MKRLLSIFLLIFSLLIFFGSMHVSAADQYKIGIKTNSCSIHVDASALGADSYFYLIGIDDIVCSSDYRIVGFCSGTGRFGLVIYSYEPFSITCTTKVFSQDRIHENVDTMSSKYGNLYYYTYYQSANSTYTLIPEDIPIYIANKDSNFHVTHVLDKISNNDTSGLYIPKPSFDDYIYSANIGYLKGFENKSCLLKEKTNLGEKVNIVNNIKRFGWDNETTTGLSLFDSNYKKMTVEIRLIGSMTITDMFGNVVDIIQKSKELLPQDAKILKWDTSFFTKTLFSDDYDKIPIMGNATYSDSYYFRLLCETNDGLYLRGGWVKVDSGFNEEEIRLQAGDITDNNEFVPVTDDYYNTGINSSIPVGIGSTIAEAENSIGTSKEGLMDSLEDIVNSLNGITALFNVLFSFLPPWALQFLGVSISLSAVLLVVKLIRG